jgi:hypothetical protein
MDGGRGGSGGDAAPDRSDARGPDAVADRGAGGATMDVSAETGGGAGVDSGRDVSVVDVGPDRGPDVVAVPDVVVVPDVAAEARVDAAPDRAAEAAPPAPDANDGGATTPDVVEAGPPDVAPEAAAPEAAPDVAADRSDGAAVIDVAVDADGPATANLAASTFSWTTDHGTVAGDAGPVTWTATFAAAGDDATLEAVFNPPVDWSAYVNLTVHFTVIQGGASVATADVQLQGSGDAEALNITDGGQMLANGLFSNISDTPEVRSAVGAFRIILHSVATGGAPPPITIQIDSIELGP